MARHVGLSERAHQGSLLLDEIGDLPPSAQVKLLRVLQTGEIERVGGDRSIAATYVSSPPPIARSSGW